MCGCVGRGSCRYLLQLRAELLWGRIVRGGRGLGSSLDRVQARAQRVQAAMEHRRVHGRDRSRPMRGLFHEETHAHQSLKRTSIGFGGPERVSNQP